MIGKQWCICLLFALAVAGCAGADEDLVPSRELPNIVVQPEDVPGGLALFDEGRLVRVDMQPPRDDPARFGREGGWKARYKRPGGETSGILVVESRVDLFDSSGGAENDFDAYPEEFDDAGWTSVEAPALGEEALAMTLVQAAFADDVRFYTIVWRQANVTASVTVQGFDDEISLADAVALARKQEARIAAARSE